MITISIRYYYMFIRIAKIKIILKPNAGENVGNFHILLLAI